ncbi:uncharacterized protein LOC132710658 [Pantherophis guttatus]|uniref:Uncharacterized protein LOC132710658 n=1 Tax=Pantherophis guttatus TaxID=94885 RepID=A0ABM3Z4H2_PANGU|nr:uncharacterized protein LOC132710658 [Pantherophis guttatus]
MAAGRKRDPVWQYFNEVPLPIGKANCKHCNKEMKGLVARMRQHHEKCCDEDDQRNTFEQAGSSGEFMDSGNYPPSRSSSFCSTVSELSIQDSASLASSSSDTQSHISLSPKRKKKPFPPGTTIDKFVIKTSRLEKELIDEKIAQFVYAMNSSFRLTENPHFINMAQSLRPGYIRCLSGTEGSQERDWQSREEVKQCSQKGMISQDSPPGLQCLVRKNKGQAPRFHAQLEKLAAA